MDTIPLFYRFLLTAFLISLLFIVPPKRYVIPASVIVAIDKARKADFLRKPDVDELQAAAAKALEPIAASGCVRAQYMMGELFYSGRYGPLDAKKALKWYQQAAAQGHPTSKLRAGSVAGSWDLVKTQEEGEAWRLKSNEAKRHIAFAALLLEAAEQGYAGAQSKLGMWRRYGVAGIERDVAEAEKWFRKAAEQGDSTAQSQLGKMYFTGVGVEKDYVVAYMWLALGYGAASNNGWNIVKERYEPQMTAEYAAEGRRLAEEWLAAHGSLKEKDPNLAMKKMYGLKPWEGEGEKSKALPCLPDGRE